MRTRLAALVMIALAACGDDAATTITTTVTTVATTTTSIAATTTTVAATTITTAPPTTTTTAAPTTTTTTPGAALVETFDAPTAMTMPHLGQYTSFEYLEGGVMRMSRVGEGGFGAGLIALYPGTYGEVTVTLRFRAAGTVSEPGVARGLVVLADDVLTNLVSVTVDDSGYVTVIPLLPGYPADYTYLDGSAVYDPVAFNDLQVMVSGGTVAIGLNGTALGEITGLPTTTGRIGVELATTTPGEAMEIDEVLIVPG